MKIIAKLAVWKFDFSQMTLREILRKDISFKTF